MIIIIILNITLNRPAYLSYYFNMYLVFSIRNVLKSNFFIKNNDILTGIKLNIDG